MPDFTFQTPCCFTRCQSNNTLGLIRKHLTHYKSSMKHRLITIFSHSFPDTLDILFISISIFYYLREQNFSSPNTRRVSGSRCVFTPKMNMELNIFRIHLAFNFIFLLLIVYTVERWESYECSNTVFYFD